jgi:hypothetical protein
VGPPHGSGQPGVPQVPGGRPGAALSTAARSGVTTTPCTASAVKLSLLRTQPTSSFFVPSVVLNVSLVTVIVSASPVVIPTCD